MTDQQSTTVRLRQKAAEDAKALMRCPCATDEQVVAYAEGLLDGISEALVQRFGAEVAYQVIQRSADILDDLLLAAQGPRKPNSCGQR